MVRKNITYLVLFTEAKSFLKISPVCSDSGCSDFVPRRRPSGLLIVFDLFIHDIDG